MMSVIWHLVRHDIRALRWPALAWLLILLAQGALMAAGPRLIDPEGPSLVVVFAGLLAGSRVVFTTLLTALLIQQDSPVGTTAFWLTRPIRPLAMVVAKACTAILVLVLLPAAAAWLTFTALGLSQADVLAGAAWTLFEQVMVVALSAMGAVITATVPQFAVAAVVGVLLLGAAMDQLRPLFVSLPRVPVPVMYANVLAWVLVTVIGSLGVAAYQYSKRRVVRAGVGVAVVLLAGLLSAMGIQAAGDQAPDAPLKTGVLDPAAVDVGAESVSIAAKTARDARGRDVRYRSAACFLRTAGVPPEIILQPVDIESTWMPAGAAPVRLERRRTGYLTTIEDPAGGEQPNQSISIGLGGVTLLNQRSSTSLAFRTVLLDVEEEEISKLPSAQGPVDATLTLRAWRYRVDAAAPLAVGSAVSARQGRLTVHAVTPTPEGVIVDLQRVFLERMQITSDVTLRGSLGRSEYLVLRNPARKQALRAAGETGRRLGYSMLEWFLFGRFGTGTIRLHFNVARGDGSRAMLDEEWLKGAELVVLRPEDLGAFTKPLRVEWLNLENVK